MPDALLKILMFVLLAVFAGGLLIIVDRIRHKIAVRKVRQFLQTLPSLSFEEFCPLYPGYEPNFLQMFREAMAQYLAIAEDKVGPALYFGPSSPLEPVIPLLYCVLFERFCPGALLQQVMAYPSSQVETLEDLICETEQLTRRKADPPASPDDQTIGR